MEHGIVWIIGILVLFAIYSLSKRAGFSGDFMDFKIAAAKVFFVILIIVILIVLANR